MFPPVLNFASRPSPFVSHHPVRDSKFDLLFEHLPTSAFAQPLFSWPYELLFPQVLGFDNHLRCPGVCLMSRTRRQFCVLSALCSKELCFIHLRTLWRSLLSFGSSRPLFSIPYGLFLQNTGGWGTCGFSRRCSLPE